MHDSAHDKSQRQRSVLLRRGKCVQRALRGVVTRLRTRRTLAAAVALVLLVLALLALCHARLLSQRPAHRDGAHDNAAVDAVADDSTSHVAASPTDRWLLRPDTQHGGSVRVMLLMVSTRVSEQLCYALASAYFADLPVVVVGFNTTPFVNAMKPSLFLDAIERAGLRDRDVVLLLDSDILFSGEDMLPFIDDYIARSPAVPSALDVRAVRAGTARAPSMYAAECNCYVRHLVEEGWVKCLQIYSKIDDTVMAYVTAHNITYNLESASVQPLRYLNSGVSIHRVWSARELLRAFVQYIAQHRPMARAGPYNTWLSDQSVLALFYNDLRTWEVEHDVLRNNSTGAATAQSGPHGLRAGQLQIDHTGRLASLLHYDKGYNYLSDAAWSGKVGNMHSASRYTVDKIQQYMSNIWQQYGGSVRLQQRTLTHVSNGTYTIDLTPPLLYVASRLKHARTHTRPDTLVLPLVWHITRSPRQPRLVRLLRVLPWYVPMRYDVTKWLRGREQLLSLLVELWTTTNLTRHEPYSRLCNNRHVFRAR